MKDAAADIRFLHVSAAQTRAKAIRTQLSLGFSFCNLAQTELDYGRIDQARLLIQKTRRIAETASRHIQEERHVPPEEVASLTEELVRLESRIHELDQKFPS